MLTRFHTRVIMIYFIKKNGTNETDCEQIHFIYNNNDTCDC